MFRKSIVAKRLEAKRGKCAAMRAAKERKRMEEPGQEWTHFEHVLRFAVHPDGRHVSVRVGEQWERCGSERSVRAVLARAIWRKCDGGAKT